jgi:farnesyl diphosphate synthase
VGKELSVTELEFMHIHKTGAIIRAAALLGLKCGKPLNADDHKHVDTFAKTIGLAFQVVDDVLDAEADTATLGKTAGKDAQQGKPTYVSAMGLARAREFAEGLRVEAMKSLEGFGARAQRLRQLADFIVLRKS